MTKKNHAYWIDKDVTDNVKIEKRILPIECSNRLKIKQVPDYIIIHEVSLGNGRSSEEYGMEHYADKILSDGLNNIKVGYHFLVGDRSIYQFIPEDECTCHSGSDFNYHSIGIERLICEGVNYSNALHNQAKLAATLMVKWNIPLSNVISHKSALLISGKNPKECPSRLIAGQYKGFYIFYREIIKCLKDNDLFFDLLVEDYTIDYDYLINKQLKRSV